MQCPHCHKEIPGTPCPECGETVPPEAKYCMMCGAPVLEPEQAPSDSADAFDLENRILCPDGTCTGIIVNGRCTECGRSYDEKQES